MRFLKTLAMIAIMLLVLACSQTRPKQGLGPMGAETQTPTPTQFVPPVDTGESPAALNCAVLEADRVARNIRSVNRFGLEQSVAIVEGTLGISRLIGTQIYAPFTMTKVHLGWHFLAGMIVMVPIDAHVRDSAHYAEPWIIGVTQGHPVDWDQAEYPYWGVPLVIISALESADYADQLRYQTWGTPHVAVVKIVEQTDERTTFDVIATLKGTFPKQFSANWYQRWGISYPGPSEETYILSARALTDYEQGKVTIASITDFRPHTEASLATARSVLFGSPLYDAAAIAPFKVSYLDSVRIHQAPLVVTSVISGWSDECCTGAGGTLFSNQIHRWLRGSHKSAVFLYGGHGYYGEETCGDRFIYGLRDLVATESGKVDFSCLTYPNGSSYGPDYANAMTSPVVIRLPFSDETLARVETWVAASPPVYRLFAAGVDPASLQQNFANAPWSKPLDAATAYLTATDLVLFTVTDVTLHSDHTVVSISTTFSPYEFAHQTQHSLKLAFRCGNTNLTEVGKRWIGAFAFPDRGNSPSQTQPFERAFLIPGSLVPEWAISGALGGKLGHFLPYYP